MLQMLRPILCNAPVPLVPDALYRFVWEGGREGRQRGKGEREGEREGRERGRKRGKGEKEGREGGREGGREERERGRERGRERRKGEREGTGTKGDRAGVCVYILTVSTAPPSVSVDSLTHAVSPAQTPPTV